MKKCKKMATQKTEEYLKLYAHGLFNRNELEEVILKYNFINTG